MTDRCVDCQVRPTITTSPRCEECRAVHRRAIDGASKRRLRAAWLRRTTSEERAEYAAITNAHKRRAYAAKQAARALPPRPLVGEGDRVIDVLDIKARGGEPERQLWLLVGRGYQLKRVRDFRAEFPDLPASGLGTRYGAAIRSVIAHPDGGITLSPNPPEAL